MPRKPKSSDVIRRDQRTDIVDAQAAIDLANAQHENVFLFAPNIIGYVRIILAALSLYYMPEHPKMCTPLYCLSCLLDAFDGLAARALGQTSKFGAVLDMVTDRCTTSCLLCFLAAAYPSLAILFQFLITLDFSSHYIHMYSSLITGATSHKLVTSDVSRILWYYYNDNRTLFTFCAGNEIFFVALYLMKYVSHPIGISIAPLLAYLPSQLSVSLGTYLFTDPWMAKAVTFVQLLTWPQLLAAVTFPIMAVKQIINCVQFWKAAKVLAGVDLAERARAREAKEH